MNNTEILKIFDEACTKVNKYLDNQVYALEVMYKECFENVPDDEIIEISVGALRPLLEGYISSLHCINQNMDAVKDYLERKSLI